MTSIRKSLIFAVTALAGLACVSSAEDGLHRGAPSGRPDFALLHAELDSYLDERWSGRTDDLVNALEAGGGFAAVGLSTAPTRAMPSLAGARLAGAPTTPIPRTPTGARLAAAVEPHHRSVGAGIALWVFVVVVALGAPGLYAYKKGLLFFARAAVPDSVAAAIHDTVAQRLLGDTGGFAAADSPTTRAAPPPPPDPGRPIAPGTPGRLTLQGVPSGARVTLNGQPFRTQGDVPPGTYKLAVEELAGRFGSDFVYAVECEFTPQFSLALKNDKNNRLKYAVPSGGAFFVDVQRQRSGYDGPIMLAVESARPGWQLINAMIPAKAAGRT